jgi:dienelactone hydrolase
MDLISRRHALGLIAGGSLMLAGCGGPRMPRHDDDAEMKRFSEQGYSSASALTPEPHHEVWRRGDEVLDVNFLLPKSPDSLPLIIYLPGLGETAEAGEVWRRAWAQAGYVVVSVQARRIGLLWTSAAARNGDFAKLAREQFATKALAARVEDIEFVVNEILRQVVAAQGIYKHIDGRRVAVAGFDLGAQTALALAGEKHPGTGLFKAPPSLRAAIVLSPHANVAQGGLAERFESIAIPVLTITATEDGDPYGLVDTPFARQAPFNFMPPGDKYLLVLEDGSHQILAGANRPIEEDAMRGPPPGRDGMGGGRMGPPGRMSRFGGSGGGPGGMVGGMGGPDMGGRPPPGGMGMRRPHGTGLRRQALVVERVSLAFLDAIIKEDPVAMEWLARDASRWMDPLARLYAKQ